MFLWIQERKSSCPSPSKFHHFQICPSGVLARSNIHASGLSHQRLLPRYNVPFSLLVPHLTGAKLFSILTQ